MFFVVRDSNMRKKALEDFKRDSELIAKGKSPVRALETDIYITKRCNLQCSYCCFKDYFDRPEVPLPDDPPLSQLQKLVDAISGKTYSLVVLGGEPFCRNDLSEFLKYVRKKDIPCIRVDTNGLRLKENIEALKFIDILAVSFDCVRLEEYPSLMENLLSDIKVLKDEMERDFPQLLFSWTTSEKDDFTNRIVPLINYAVENGFYVKFLPVKKGQKADWKKHREIVMKALDYDPGGVVTNNLRHTQLLSEKFNFHNCLQGIQYYIDFNGSFLYPCDEFPEQKVGSVYRYSIDELFDRGKKRFGIYPQKNAVCRHCPSGCHSDNSFIFRNPKYQFDLLS